MPSRITSFFSPVAGTKRKASDISSDDDDGTIVVRPQKTTRTREPLKELQQPAGVEKQQDGVEVAVPKYNDEFVAQFVRIPSTSSPTTERPYAVASTQPIRQHTSTQRTKKSVHAQTRSKRAATSKVANQAKYWLVVSDEEDGLADVPSEGSVFGESDNSASDIASTMTDNEDFDDGSAIETNDDEQADGGLLSERDLDARKRQSKPGKLKKIERRIGDNAFQKKPKGAPTSKSMHTLLKGKSEGLDHSLAPLSNIDDIFVDIVKNANALGFDKAVRHLEGHALRVATMCSGTESPLLALEMIREATATLSLGALNVQHLFSAEIVPYKQAYIERNFAPPIIFQNITELIGSKKDVTPMATTAFGSRAPVPTEVDLLIAGTSCVDFSRLNNKKKNLADGGESGDTWSAVRDYSEAYRPAIVILENVRGADWDTMLEEYRKIDYDSAGVLVDSKNYYIPHTRQRGYMVCFAKEKLAKAGIHKSPAQKWIELVANLKRPTSTPVSSFLLPDDRVMRRNNWNEEVGMNYDWSQCEITQMEYRQEHRLGIGRPITHWSESGSMLAPDHAFGPWFSRQVERVLDTIDGATLRKALPKHNMYDTSYKTRIWDLSQNIYRHEDTQPFGICTCITPHGILYLSDAARPLVPEETLTLQGIPLKKISFTTETAQEMQDLAGNAMTSTVIGTAIVAALTASYKAIEKTAVTNAMTARPPDILPTIAFGSNTPFSACHSHNLAEIDLAGLLQRARQARKYCQCERSKNLTKKPIQQCADCGHTACIVCAGNSPHKYRQYLDLRQSPAIFEAELRRVLPLRLMFSEAPDLMGYGAEEDYTSAVTSAAGQTFALSVIRWTHCWTVTYSAANAHLDLVIDDVHAEWRLFADVDKQMPGNHPLRRLLQQPIAKASINEGILGDAWEWRIPQYDESKIDIAGSHSTIASWWSRNGMPDFTDHTVPEFLSIQATPSVANGLSTRLNGQYRYLPDCGKACSSLYVRQQDSTISETEPSVFFFLDPTRTGAPDEDCFVFSENIARLEYGEVRPILARIAAPWRPWARDSGTAKWKLKTAKLITDDVWHKSAETRLVPHAIDIQTDRLRDDAILPENLDCSGAIALVGCRFPSALLSSTTLRQFVGSQDDKFFEENAWLMEAMRREVLDTDWRTLQSCHHTASDCLTCAPKRPLLRWELDSTQSIKPSVDPQSAAWYERAIKTREDPIFMKVNQDNGSTAQLTLAINMMSLAHRAQARLPPEVQLADLKWRFATSQENIYRPTPFRIGATRDIEPFDEPIGMNVDLFPKQRIALAWMQRQEEGTVFLLEEAEETFLPSLGWRAEVRAQGSVTVRGGICADHPGFGKTVTSLALIKSEKRLRASIHNEIATRQAKAAAQGLIPTAATLIVCPPSLVSQWTNEIKEKLGSTSDVIIIKSVANLKKYTIKGFQTASIVILNRNVLVSESYVESLATFAAIPGPATNSGRAFGQWLEHAQKPIPGHLAILREHGLKALERHLKIVYKDNIESKEFEAAIPSRRLRGKDYIASKNKGKGKSSAAENLPALGTLDTSGISIPLLGMFFFNRLIVDEFHQHDAREHAAVKALKADKRWGLSGTPAINDFYEVAQMGELLGVKLRIGSDAQGIMKTKNSRELRKGMSPFELFDEMRQKPSDSMHSRIHEIDQLFLDTFVRQNIMDFGGIQYSDNIVPVELDLVHRVTYMELSQHMNSMSMRIKKGKKGSTSEDHVSDRHTRISEAITSSLTAEEALSKTAAKMEENNLDSLVKIRADQIEAILSDLPRAIRKARNDGDTFNLWRSGLTTRNLGDQDTVYMISEIIDQSCGKLKPTAQTKKSNGETKTRADTAALNQLCNRLLVAKRSSRYLQSVQGLVDQARNDRARLSSCCDNPDCAQNDDKQVAVSALCGHALCADCSSFLKERAILQCPARGCTNAMQDFHYLWTSKVSDLASRAHTLYGAKIERTIHLIKDITSEGDQAIIFVQYEMQVLDVEAALLDYGIEAEAVKTASEADQKIKRFHEKDCRVLVLNASDETAAGLNLQNANHVIFLSPLLRDTQYTYDATMAQAIGRVRRHGQKKQIHVYRIVALDTIDVDILEHRERRVDALVELDAPAIETPAGMVQKRDVHGEVVRERTQLVRESGRFSLRPHSWLVQSSSATEGVGADADAGEMEKVRGKSRVMGWEDFSSLVKFSKTFTEDDE